MVGHLFSLIISLLSNFTHIFHQKYSKKEFKILKNLKTYNEHKIKVHGDSKLVIEQMKGNWKVKATNLVPLWKEAHELLKDFKNIGPC